MNENPQDRPGVHLDPGIPPAPDGNRGPAAPGTPPENGTPPGYPPPPWPYWEEEKPPASSGWSAASLVLGILSVVLCCSSFPSLICAALAIVFAIVSRTKKRAFDGMAIAGLVLGMIGVVLGLLFLLCFLEIIEEALAEFNALEEEFLYDEPGIPGVAFFRFLFRL